METRLSQGDLDVMTMDWYLARVDLTVVIYLNGVVARADLSVSCAVYMET